MSDVDAATAAIRPRRAWTRRRIALGGVVVGVLLLVAGAGLAAFRYLPALDEARALRSDLEGMADRVQEAGLAIDRPTVDALDGDLAAARARLDHLRGLAAGDPLIGIARAFPPTSSNVRGADSLLAAGDSLLDAVGDGLAIGRDYLEIRDARSADPGQGSALAQLVELMATSRERAVSAAASVADARQALAGVPDGMLPQLESIRDAMSSRIERYQPLLDSYVVVSDRLPAILGWDGPRRYLVLTQDPAEVRPSGGLIGSYGIIAFNRGRLVEQRFRGVAELDYPWDFKFVKPPQELADYLLGPSQPWQLADAGWSPDYPTSAQTALRLYTNESGDADIDGVIAITTYTVDDLLKITGPVSVPGYDVTIASGATTLKVLQATRSASPGVDRKAFLPAFADQLFTALEALPADRWGDLAISASTLREGHLLLAWFRDAADETLATRGGFDGSIRQDPGDYLYPVDSNVAPATKLNAWTSRGLDLNVEIDEVGNARHVLGITWDNRVESQDGATYRAMKNVGGRILGMYERLLVPERSRVEAIRGGELAHVTSPAVVEDEAGRMAIGTYLMVPPGGTTLESTWTSPYAADVDETDGVYRLTIQQQPGLLPGPLTLVIHVPTGWHITAASPGLTVTGGVATLTTIFERDLVVGVQYEQ